MKVTDIIKENKYKVISIFDIKQGAYDNHNKNTSHHCVIIKNEDDGSQNQHKRRRIDNEPCYT